LSGVTADAQVVSSLMMGGSSGLAGGWIGWEIDDLVNGETVVFSRRQPAPTLGLNRQSIAVTVSF
jgi:hypothetical protein